MVLVQSLYSKGGTSLLAANRRFIVRTCDRGGIAEKSLLTLETTSDHGLVETIVHEYVHQPFAYVYI